MTENTDILIIGSGISGLLVAREMVMAGRSVTVIDKSALGQESSWAGGGILLPIYPWRQSPAISELVVKSLSLYPQLAKQLVDSTGIDPQWWPCGMLICKNPDIDLATQWCAHYGIRHLPVSADLLEPLTTRFDHPLWLPDIAQARNPRLLKSLLAYLQTQNVRFVEQAEIVAINTDNDRVTHLDCNDRRYQFDQLVICAGAWTSDLLKQWLPDQSLNLPIQPIRGQMLVFEAKAETLRQMVLDGDHYLIPRRDGKILVGSTVEDAGFEKLTTEDARQWLHNFAIKLLPSLKQFPISHHWAGLRPATPQGIPYIGKHPTLNNLTVNAGHFRNGLIMGPASAQLAADLILDRPTCIDATPYALDRD